MKRIRLCSACLLGINSKYDGKAKADKRVTKLLEKEVLIPVCPETLGGCPTPREDSAIKNGRVFTLTGKDETDLYRRGAREVLKIAKLYKIKEAILKQRSPSCGSGQIYDGLSSKKIIKGDGICTALLKKNKIKVISEEDI